MKKVDFYRDKQVLVIGMGKSGVNSAKLLSNLGAKVIVNDKTNNPDSQQVAELESLQVKVVTGSHPLELLNGTDLVVKNPVVPYSNPLVKKAQTIGISIITEPELAYQISDSMIIGVTGTNGKTTTTTMITDILNCKRTKGVVYAAGNIGIPATMIAQKANQNDVIVTELSSFQLMGIQQFHPHIAVLTNIYEAHTDWHGSHENYVRAKMNLLKNQTRNDYFVVNWDNKEARLFTKYTPAQIIPFSRTDQIESGSYERNSVLYYKGEPILNASEIGVPGSHNVENALAAIAVAKLVGQSNGNIKDVLSHFSGVRHRMQYVTTFNERKFYNDSKATDIEATQKALDGFSNPVVLLAGGLDRGFKFDRLVPYLKKHVHALIVFGETADLIAEAGKKAGIDDIIKTKDAVTAVPEAYGVSNPGDIILLSPACASWDQWPTFEVRGDKYINAVENLIHNTED